MPSYVGNKRHDLWSLSMAQLMELLKKTRMHAKEGFQQQPQQKQQQQK
jgi:hypothetical protein